MKFTVRSQARHAHPLNLAIFKLGRCLDTRGRKGSRSTEDCVPGLPGADVHREHVVPCDSPPRQYDIAAHARSKTRRCTRCLHLDELLR